MITFPTFTMMVGLPGSGKSTIANDMASTNTVVLSSDKIREELYGNENIQGNPNEVFHQMQVRTVAALKEGKDVIYDATNLTRKNRESILSLIPNGIRKDCVVVYVPVDICIERDSNRNRVVGKTVINDMVKRFQMPYYDEGFDDISINRNYQYDPDEEYRKAIILNTMNIPHDNPNHTYGILKHCQAAQQHAINKGYDYDIRIAALYHDCGKPYVKSFINGKGEKTDIAHYYSHQNVSAYLAMEIITDINVLWLISNHMSPFLNEKYYQNLPKYLKDKIDELHECDVNAH